MKPRRLGKIWQFGLGSLFCVIGVLTIAVFAGLHYFLPPPTVGELKPVSGSLASRIEVHRPPKGAPWASFAMNTPNMTLDARINNYSFLLNCDDTPALLRLGAGAEIVAWFTEKDIADRTNAVAWRIQHAGEDFLSFDQSLAAQQAQERHYFSFSLWMLAIGVALSAWGWCISIAERRKFRNVL